VGGALVREVGWAQAQGRVFFLYVCLFVYFVSCVRILAGCGQRHDNPGVLSAPPALISSSHGQGKACCAV
jgi:hypothetical protein